MNWESFMGLPLMARVSIVSGIAAFLLLLLLDREAANNLMNLIKVVPVVFVVNNYVARKAKPEELPTPAPLDKQPLN